MQDILILATLGLILGGSAGYIWKSKRAGRKCIGCPDSGSCSGCHCGCGK